MDFFFYFYKIQTKSIKHLHDQEFILSELNFEMLINYFTGYPNTDETTPILDILEGMKPSNTTRGGTSPLGELVGNFFKKSFV